MTRLTGNALFKPDVEDTLELAGMIDALPRDIRLIIYGQVQAHMTMAGMGIQPEPPTPPPAAGIARAV